jgi:signal transduction histidine kinase/CheY-like chemotaxis protein
MTSVRLHRLLLVASLLVPAVVFVAAAWWNRSEVVRENTETIARTAAVLHEHARKVFDTVELALARVDDRVRTMSWDDISSQETNAFLRNLKAPLEHAVSIWVTDADGYVRAGSQDWNPAVAIADREWFSAQRDRDAGTYISASYEGKATKTASFAVSRRRSTQDGRFNGIIHVALSPEYFSHFFKEAAPAGPNVAALFKESGEILARSPSLPQSNARSLRESDLMRAIAARPEGGHLSGISTTDQLLRFYAYRHVSPYPLYVTFGVDADVVFQHWYRNVLIYGAVAAVSSLTLLLVSWLALRRAQSEQAALAQLRRESEQRLSAEQRLLQSQKMESIGQLTGGIAHDFNNLLAVVLGNLDLLRKRIKDDDRAGRLLEGAIQGAQRGAALTQRLLAFSRRQDLTPQAVDVPKLVGSMTDLLSRSLGASISISTQFPPDLPQVNVDENQLELALLNLAVNARDAMPIGGTITISARAVEIQAGQDSGLSPGRYVCIRVRDTGLGMDAETLSRAVEPFFTTKGIGKGTGLGLSMIHGFAVQSGGALKLASVPGQGTSAEMWLPQGEPAVGNRPRDRQSPMPHRVCRVLLVEDDALVMGGTAAMLEDLGHTVVEAASGEEALAALAEDPSIDLVVTDHSMPGMTGLELVDRIRSTSPTMPILLASGHAELPEGKGLSVPRLTKPFRQDELAHAIASIVTPTCDPVSVVAFRRP